MKTVKRILQILLLSVVFTCVISAVPNMPGQTIEAQAATVKLNKKSVTLIKGQTTTLKMKGTSKKVTWSSSKESIATVSSKGKVTAKKKGTTTITAKVGGKKYTCKVTVEAPKISKTSLTLTKGKTSTLKIAGTTQDVTWSSSKKSVATVNSKGKVTAKKKGTATIIATVGGEKYTCALTVKSSSSGGKSQTFGKLKVTSYKTDEGVVAIVKNNYKYTVELTMDCLFYNKKGTLIQKRSDDNTALKSGAECALWAYYDAANYSSYKLKFSTSKAGSYITTNASKISVKGNYGDGNVMVTVKNKGKSAEYTIIAIVFYKSGKVVGYDYSYANVESKGSTDYLQFYYPYDSKFNTIVPDKYKIYVNCSYSYTW